MEKQLNHRDVEQILLILSDILNVRSSGGPVQGPVIDHWVPVSVGNWHRLWGQVTGHPRGLEGDVMTSTVFYLDPVAGLARTASRWYQLGTPLRADKSMPDGTLVFGPYSQEASIEETVALADLMPDLLVLDAKRLGDAEQLRRTIEVRDQWVAGR
jgi:hypothetical protein